ncbi:N-acetyltransferase [Pedobacter changchengzhani]|uniref:N-acetyltransferase n=1 Tax=Pedobacter changchengzhani TaxID=2529274 RepID=A0A4R5MJ56_9SPHI|nr:GNAT family N-acetyltransferase [Pedobacter changchengzhani]TDG35099.1 N-acetyltransferase [Pedobacter changchengzhani]
MIRPYEVTDKDEVINLIKLNTPKYFAFEEEADLIEYLEKKRQLYYVLIFEGKLVGCGGINFTDDNTTATISWDIFHPNFHCRGLGTRMLKYRIDKLSALATIEKIVVRTTQITYKFYQKYGFELVEIKKDYWAVGFDLYHMNLAVT